MNFNFTKRGKIICYGLMAVGVIAMIAGMTTDHSEHHMHFWSNLLINGLFFSFISLGALFFLALQYATETAWSVMVRRIYEAIMAYIPIGMGILVIIFLASSFHLNHLYHWMDAELYKPAMVVESAESFTLSNLPVDQSVLIPEGGNENDVVEALMRGDEFNVEGKTIVLNKKFDNIIAGKQAYLNIPFFWIRALVYMGCFIFFARYFRKKSLLEDQKGGTQIHITNYKRGALFLVFFALFSSALAWDWVMSIDTHWFSTMFGWYTFSGMWVTAMIVAVILVLYLKSKGLMPHVNDSHIHDMGKWVFAISFLWTYLWFCQFMLIWYSDIPEEVTYFHERFEGYKIPMWTTFFVNFAVPMIMLMARDTKRNSKFLITVGTIIFFGHWLDVYMMITPGTMHQHGSFGWLEIGMMLGFLGLFIYVVLNALTKAPLVPQKSPYLDESTHHHI